MTVNDAIIIEDIQGYLDFLNEAFGYDAYTISDDCNKILFEDEDGNIEDATSETMMEYARMANTRAEMFGK